MIRSCPQIPPPGYTAVAAHRKTLRAVNGHVSSQGILDLQMDSEESQSVFPLFDYGCIYDHILMVINT